MAAKAGLVSVPMDILVTLPDYLHDIEDYINLSAACRSLRRAMNAATAKQILRLAANASRVFFRPSPHFLVVATARELGDWARLAPENERQLALQVQDGLKGLLDLALVHCGLTMERIRELYGMRFSLINPVTDIMDKCVGKQWYGLEDFWDGGASDAYTIDSDPSASVFHLAIYGELFGPDFEAYLDRDDGTRTLSVETRLEFVKYCIPDFATYDCQRHARDVRLPDGSIDPRRAVKNTGPYLSGLAGNFVNSNNIALTWILKSSRWKPCWKAMRAKAGPDFGELNDNWYRIEGDWRQRLWEACMVTQGLQGYEMIRKTSQDPWIEKVKNWRDRIEKIQKEPEQVHIGRTWTHDYPWLPGDLRVLATGYLSNT